jgi:hypothetical protein
MLYLARENKTAQARSFSQRLILLRKEETDAA